MVLGRALYVMVLATARSSVVKVGIWVEDLERSRLIEHYGQRCADCGVVLEKPESQGAVCVECGEPLCQDCAAAHLKRDEPMVCATCWESGTLNGEDV
jgi:hypothetical protein